MLMKNNKHHKLRDPLRRYVRTESYGSVQLMASSTCQTLGAKRWRTQTKPWRIENTQATEPQKIELNIKEIIIDQLWCMNHRYICAIYDVCDVYVYILFSITPYGVY